jgi:hypothetical protein
MGREAPVTADTFLSVPPCDVSHLGEGVDVVIVGAPDGTPCTPGEASHARDAPDAMRRSIKAAASDLTRWDFDQNGPLLAKDLTVRNAGNIVTDPATPGRNRENIRAAIRAILDASAVPVLLGGDDSGRFRSLKHSKRTDRLPLFKLMHISTGAKRETAFDTRSRARCGAQVKCPWSSASFRWGYVASARRGKATSTMLCTGELGSFPRPACTDMA